MTLGLAWLRHSGNVRELLVASDSRLSGGQFWDANPKILLLPRTDAVISFAGATHDAYPLMLQAYNAIQMFPPARDRTLDLTDLRGHLTRVFNHSLKFISNLPKGQEKVVPEAIFLLAGYSWKSQRFKIWTLYFEPNLGEYTFRPAKPWKIERGRSQKVIAFVGDEAAVADARNRLVARLREKQTLDKEVGLDMEPFEVLRDVIRSHEFSSVGGAPQLVKIYEHMNVVPFGVLWPNASSKIVTYLGRPLMEYEKTASRNVDPDNPFFDPKSVGNLLKTTT
jgi:hypothetical protein